jgi:hypothetical protein
LLLKGIILVWVVNILATEPKIWSICNLRSVVSN